MRTELHSYLPFESFETPKKWWWESSYIHTCLLKALSHHKKRWWEPSYIHNCLLKALRHQKNGDKNPATFIPAFWKLWAAIKTVMRTQLHSYLPFESFETPKKWWWEPSYIHTCLLKALRHHKNGDENPATFIHAFWKLWDTINTVMRTQLHSKYLPFESFEMP